MSLPSVPPHARQTILTTALHLTGLWAIVIALPLLDQLGRNPEFFAAHRGDGTDVVLLAVFLLLAPPVAATAIAAAIARPPSRLRRFGEPGTGEPVTRLRRVTAVMVGLLSAGFAVQLFHRVYADDWRASAAIATLVAVVAGLAYARGPIVRLFLTVLSPAPLAVMVLFLSGFGIRGVMAWADLQATQGSRAQTVVPASGDAINSHVALLIFDEVPLTSIMSGDGGIDATRFPNLAALARDGIWFRNASTVSEFTRFAVPPIATGRYPLPRGAPEPSHYPDTLFSLLGDTHRMVVSEPLTRLCPEYLCMGPPVSRSSRLRRMLSDLGVVGLHLLLPRDLRTELPSLNVGWAGFAAPWDRDRQSQPFWRRLWLNGAVLDPMTEVSAFLDRVGREATTQPTLFFMHTIVSHYPYHYLPSGQRFHSRRPPSAFALKENFLNDRLWAISMLYQKHLLQVGLVDTLVGRFVDRLKAAGIYDDTLIVVTSDHGVAFQPNAPYRILTRATAPEIIPVPLILKPPVGSEAPRGVVNDANVQSIDVLPTIADVMNRSIGWPIDGISALDASATRPDRKTVFWSQAEKQEVFSADEIASARDATVVRKISLLGTAAFPRPVFAEADWLLGRALESLDLSTDAIGWQCEIDEPTQFLRVDAESAELPAQINGRLEPEARATTAQVPIAIAVNGRIVAVTQTWKLSNEWMAVFDPKVLKDGPNDVAVFVVDLPRQRLHRIFQTHGETAR